MNELLQPLKDNQYRRILGVNFFVGDAAEAVGIGAQGGLVVVLHGRAACY